MTPEDHVHESGPVLVTGGGSIRVEGEAVRRGELLDRRPMIAWCLAWTMPGVAIAEHVLDRDPWLVRWGLGSALGGTVGRLLWDVFGPSDS